MSNIFQNERKRFSITKTMCCFPSEVKLKMNAGNRLIYNRRKRFYNRFFRFFRSKVKRFSIRPVILEQFS